MMLTFVGDLTRSQLPSMTTTLQYPHLPHSHNHPPTHNDGRINASTVQQTFTDPSESARSKSTFYRTIDPANSCQFLYQQGAPFEAFQHPAVPLCRGSDVLAPLPEYQLRLPSTLLLLRRVMAVPDDSCRSSTKTTLLIPSMPDKAPRGNASIATQTPSTQTKKEKQSKRQGGLPMSDADLIIVARVLFSCT